MGLDYLAQKMISDDRLSPPTRNRFMKSRELSRMKGYIAWVFHILLLGNDLSPERLKNRITSMNRFVEASVSIMEDEVKTQVSLLAPQRRSSGYARIVTES
ncbi:unnamed protein product [Eruca vesicaria subsp. sativa]|uniref:Uncharacterized protein n=1 Tax=Eruca vesicaria subsp. sativa TaxID=29727 RepID=A0ABC8LN83_ERUVS|nr:unnamed protein product [Eruca vesicaria subsp. sativa]